MFGSQVLDIAIGLVFVFLLVSSLVTIVNEMIASFWSSSRAKWLSKGMDRLLDPTWATKLFAHPLIDGSAPTQGRKPSYIPSRSFANVLLDIVRKESAELTPIRQALQAALDASPADALNASITLSDRLVGAIKAASPAVRATPTVKPAVTKDLLALLQRLGPGSNPEEARAEIQRFIDALPSCYLREVIAEFPGDKIRETLLVLFDDAENDIDKFKQNIEVWFNNAMDRVGGWYKRRTQTVITVLSVLATIGLNVDALLIVKHLQTNPGVRTALVAQAKTYSESASAPHSTASVVAGAASGTSPSQVSAIEKRLEQLSLPIGWVRPVPSKTDAISTAAAQKEAIAALAAVEEASAAASAARAALATAPAASSAEMQAQVTTTSAAASAAEATFVTANRKAIDSVHKPSDAEIDDRLVLPERWGWPSDWDWGWFGDTIRFHFLGWLLTALAATLGAPFWFDTLNRIISIRSAGKAPEEKPKPPRDVPKPLEPGQSPKQS